ncbi:MAG: hypothetical protein GC159_04890 [Phycisphaera sp.]|nr:hypothetical protein [Phycisphaera sp.]
MSKRPDQSDTPEDPSKDASSGASSVDEMHDAPMDGSVRETLESIVIAFVLAFAFRAFIVEAFVIPTGSMAPTLLGEHIAVVCPQCGYSFTMGPNDSSGRWTMCPECDYPISRPLDTLTPQPKSTGDRILVLKFLYAFREPRRWEVVVFKNPQDPSQNYIKRLIGLPNEQLRILSGNIYTRPLRDDGTPDETAEWQIQRKPDDLQRRLWQAVYHSDYRPLDEGMSGERQIAWNVPWQPVGANARRWSLDEHAPRWTYDAKGADGPGVMSFMFDERTTYNYYYYNMLTSEGPGGVSPIEDMRIAATVSPKAAGCRVFLDLSGRGMLARGVIDPDGRVSIQTAEADRRTDLDGKLEWKTRVEGRRDPLAVGRGTRVEMWNVDQGLTLWVGGERVLEWRYSLDDIGQNIADVYNSNREGPMAARLGVEGADATVRSLDLDRDLYYTQHVGVGSPDLGTRDNPATLGPDQFFCLGDNSPQSSDSRAWDSIDPAVQYTLGIGDDDSAMRRRYTGRVPRDLMIGRAFFVYFPAPDKFFVPAFGKMRFIH